jgi:aminopeptidase YwaD
MSKRHLLIATAILAFASVSAHAQTATGDWQVKQEWVAAHEAFLAGDALRGRGSATPDEGVAAAYVAAMFQSYGLKTAPGMTSYLQTAGVTKTTPSGHTSLTVGGVTLTQGSGLTVLLGSGRANAGALTVGGDDPAAFPAAEVLLIAPPEGNGGGAWINAAGAKGANLVILRETDFLKAAATRRPPRPSSRLTDATPRQGQIDAVLVSAADYDRLKALAGTTASIDPGAVQRVESVTTNAIGYLPGNDPAAGVLLISAHLDHLGVRPDGTIMHGANDDASGTTAVLELAHALASGEAHRRGILFVAYGSEEIGGLGSTYFGEHPPVPLTDIVANLEIEMIGAQDPKMEPGVMMMTGFDRSNFGPTLKEKGALVAPDLYPEQNFFQRSDNYSLALKGIVAHTVSGWAVTPTYHDATDDIAHLDLPFMTRAIQSLIEPLRWMASSDFTPEWAPGGRPEPR